MKRHYSIDMTTGPITKKLIQFVLPLMASLLLQQLYNAADKAVVGQFAENGELALAAVGATGSPTSLILNLVFGISAGAGIISANLLGGKQEAALRRNMHTTVAVGLVSGILLMIVGICVARPLLTLMSCPENVLDTAVLYMRIYFVGMPATMLYNFASGILRTFGDSRRPMVILGISGLVNVALNIIFVICFHMSVDGVAWATVIAQTVSTIWILCILFSKKDAYKMTVRELNLFPQEVLTILRVGIPCGMNGVVFSIANVIIQSTINGWGDMTIAGAAASDSITNISYQVLSAFYTATMTFSGQCYGAGKIHRIRKLLLCSTGLCMGIMASIALVATLIPHTLIGIFNANPDVLRAGTEKLLTVSWGYVVYALCETLMGCLRGMRKNVTPTIINIGCACILRVIWVAFIYPLHPEVWFLYFCYLVSYIANLCIMLPYYFVVIRKLEHEHADALAET